MTFYMLQNRPGTNFDDKISNLNYNILNVFQLLCVTVVLFKVGTLIFLARNINPR